MRATDHFSELTATNMKFDYVANTRCMWIEAMESRTLLSARPGDIDTGFATGGKLVIATNGTEGFNVLGGAVEADGSEIVVGERRRAASDDFVAARLKPDGLLDTSFGLAGNAELGNDITGGIYSNFIVSVQDDGKILVGGIPASEHLASLGDIAVLRLNSDGTRDNSFGQAGIALVPSFLDAAFNQQITRIAVQDDGKILIGSNIGFDEFSFARLDAQGTLDTEYRNGGLFHTKLGVGGLHNVVDAEVQTDGSILFAGAKGIDALIAIERYDASGHFDSHFGQNGRILTDLPAEKYRNPVVNQGPDGELVVCMWTDPLNGGKTVITLARFHADGSPDSAFGVDGKASTPVDDFELDFANDVSPIPKFQGDRIIFAESTTGGTFVYRITPSGTLDPSFGTNGRAVLDNAAFIENTDPLQIADDGKIYAANFDYDLRLTRATVDGQLDPTYGAAHDGVANVPVSGPGTDTLSAAAIRPDGTFMLLGSSASSTRDQRFLKRYLASGEPDLAVGAAGDLNTIPDYYFGQKPAQMVVTPRDAVVLAYSIPGTIGTYGFPRLLKFTSSGELDRSFISDRAPTSLIEFGLLGFAMETDGTLAVLAKRASQGLDRLIVYSPKGLRLHARAFTAAEADGASIAAAPHGKIVLAGPFSRSSPGLQVSRYDESLRPDVSFGTNGVVTPKLTADFFLKAVTTQSNGKILLAGRSGNRFVLARLNADGGADVSFGKDGIVSTVVASQNAAPVLRNVVIQANGRIIVGGSTNASRNADFLLVRYTSKGRLDASFGQAGIVTSDFGGNETLTSIGLTPDNKLMAFGTITYTGDGITTRNDSDILVARYAL